MSVFVLGPFIDHDEPTPTVVVVPPTKVGIVFGTPATAPGGICNVILADTNADPAVCPTAVHVFFVPKGTEPTGDNKTPEWFLGNSEIKKAVVSVPTDRPAVQVSAQVSDLTPGLYFVQTVLEYTS